MSQARRVLASLTTATAVVSCISFEVTMLDLTSYTIAYAHAARNRYAERLHSLVEDLHSLPMAVDAPGPVLVPGDPERFYTNEQTSTGVKLHKNVAATLVKLGESLGVDRPKVTWQE